MAIRQNHFLIVLALGMSLAIGPAFSHAEVKVALTPLAPALPFSGHTPVSMETLAGQRGGAAEVVNIKNQSMIDGTLHDNQAYNLNTGGNSVTDGSFAGASGFVMAVQNTGNNVLIQNSMIINLQVQ